jgi:hypothetical protein
MKCPKCQANNGDHRSFCKRCGGRILAHCPQCAFSNETDDAYCGGCGASLSGHPVSPQESRTPAPQSHAPNLHTSLLAELLKEETASAPPTSKEAKKGVSQEEIDQLFNN